VREHLAITPAPWSFGRSRYRVRAIPRRRCRQCQRENCQRENSTSAEFCLILPDKGALELLRGECGRGSSASYSRSPYLLDASIAQSPSAFVCAWDVVADENCQIVVLRSGPLLDCSDDLTRGGGRSKFSCLPQPCHPSLRCLVSMIVFALIYIWH